MARVQLFLSSHPPRRMGRRLRSLLLAWTLALLLPQLHARAITPASQQQPPPPFDLWALVSPWLQKHGWLGFAVVGGFALVGYVLSQAQNIESARRLLGLEWKKEEPLPCSNSTHGPNSPLITGGTFQPGGDQFIGGEHVHQTHLPPPPDPKLPDTYTPHTLPERTTSAECFVGREAELQRLAELLTPEGSRVYLTGMGGVGKSELALQHAYDHLDHYRGGIVRLDARQGLSAMAAQLVTFFRTRFPTVALPDDTSPLELLPVFWSQWPAGNTPPEPVLLILDDQRGENLPEDEGNTLGYAAERQFFAGLPPRFRRLISQREPAPTGAKEIELPLLQRQASLELLALQAGNRGQARLQAEPQAAYALCEEVGDLPLALVLLGARLAERPELRLSQLLEELRSKGAEAKALLQAHPELGAQRGVVEALLISWQPLSEAAKSLGVLLGGMAPTAIPWELVEACRLPEQEVEEGSAFGAQQVALRRAQLLERLDDGFYKLHPLVRQFIRLQSRQLEKVAVRWRKKLAAAVTQVCRERIPQTLTRKQVDALEPVLPHIRHVAEHYTAELSAEDFLVPFARLSWIAEHEGAFEEALRWCESGLQKCEKQLGPTHPATGSALNNLAQLLQSTNRLVEAEPLMRRVLAIFEKSYSTDDPIIALALNNLALLLKETNRLAEAEPLLRRALAINEASYGPGHPTVATALNNLAQLLQATNRLKEAEPLLRQALTYDQASYGPDHPNVSRDLNNLAQLLQATNRLSEAESLYLQAIAITEASYGSDHPNVATALNNLATLLQATNRLAEAEQLMRQALAIVEASYGPNHPTVATALNNLATLLGATNRLSEAEPLIQRALAIDEASYGPDHPDIARDLNTLALLLQANNCLAEAEPLMRQNVEILIAFNQHGCQHPQLETASRNYRQLLQELGISESEIEAKLQRLSPPSS